jgi:hypothetical protein
VPLLVFLLGLVLTGCSGLLVRQDDAVPVVVAKTLWRGLLGVTTLGLSEIHMSALRGEMNAEALAEDRLRDYEAHLTYLVNNEALSRTEAEDLYQRYASLVFQETLAVIAGGDNSDYWTGPLSVGYPVYAVGGSSVSVVGLPAGYHRRFGRFSQRSFGVASWHGSRASSARWSRIGHGSRSFFRGASSGKGSGRRGGRR